MSAKLNYILPQGAFEIVRDRIGQILFDELNNQAQLSSVAPPGIFKERFVPVQASECPIVIVNYAQGVLDGWHQGQTNHLATFNIDVYVGMPSGTGGDGDQAALMGLEHLLSVCRAILEDPIYKTLGFATPPPFIMGRRATAINIADPNKVNTDNICMGRLSFEVKIPETSQLIAPVIAASFDTHVTLAGSDKGYFWQEYYGL